jgi:hypothetical protein
MISGRDARCFKSQTNSLFVGKSKTKTAGEVDEKSQPKARHKPEASTINIKN